MKTWNWLDEAARKIYPCWDMHLEVYSYLYWTEIIEEENSRESLKASNLVIPKVLCYRVLNIETICATIGSSQPDKSQQKFLRDYSGKIILSYLIWLDGVAPDVCIYCWNNLKNA